MKSDGGKMWGGGQGSCQLRQGQLSRCTRVGRSTPSLSATISSDRTSISHIAYRAACWERSRQLFAVRLLIHRGHHTVSRVADPAFIPRARGEAEIRLPSHSRHQMFFPVTDSASADADLHAISGPPTRLLVPGLRCAWDPRTCRIGSRMVNSETAT